ncbi:MAG: hypothetical protein V9E87_03115 [Gemmatimonadales bacterium]
MAFTARNQAVSVSARSVEVNIDAAGIEAAVMPSNEASWLAGV